MYPSGEIRRFDKGSPLFATGCSVTFGGGINRWQIPHRKLPLPLAVAFVACQEIYSDQRTGVSILTGPTSHVPLHQFPAHVRLSVWLEFTGGHGCYQPRLCLLDEADEVVWGWTPPEPLEHINPLLPHQVTFHDLMLAVPRPGRYRLVLLFNGEELVQRAMWFGPKQAFQA